MGNIWTAVAVVALVAALGVSLGAALSVILR